MLGKLIGKVVAVPFRLPQIAIEALDDIIEEVDKALDGKK